MRLCIVIALAEYFDKSFGYMKDGEYHMIKRMQNYRSVINT